MPKIAASKPAIKAPRRCAPVYRVRNWPAYEAGLKQRGSLTFWITLQALRGWYHQGPTQRGRQNTFSDLAIQTALMLRLVSTLPLRQTEGVLTSILALMGVDLRVPDHTTLCRRQGDLNVDLPVQSHHAPIHLVVDSTVLKGYGEGEWKVRQHGFYKRRTWRKLHS